MELDGSKQVCGICSNWRGKRELVKNTVIVKPSSKGQCVLLNKVKPPHGGCDQWQRWNGEKNSE